jgi:quinoprotein glucose dehydrogenase
MRMPLTLAVAARAATALSRPRRPQSANEGTSYGRDAAGTRNSPLTQVTPGNVSRLAPAWTYRTGEFARADEHTRFEATPLMVDGTLYLSTPFGRAIALDPATGRERWTYDAHVDATNDFGDPASRGVSTWLDPRAKAGTHCRRRIYLPTLDARIIALDSRTGTPCRGFAHDGVVSLRDNLRNAPV